MHRTREVVRSALATALVLAASAAPAVAADVGKRDHAFNATGVVKPSGEKPQSKLWYAHGTWWGSLFHLASEKYRVHRFDPLMQTWIDTGTELDERNSSHADTLWDGRHLYVASAAGTSNIKIMRLSYDSRARRWVRDAGYDHPIATAAPIEAVVIDKDGTGRLWITYTEDNPPATPGGPVTSRTVRVAHTGANGAWGAPFALPQTSAANLSADDISAVVAYSGHVGVMWSNQADQVIYFATHANGAPDSAWTQEAALSGPWAADDHLNLKSVQGAGGRVFAVVKTSKGDHLPDPLEPQIVLAERRSTGTWTPHTFGTAGEDHTRPVVLTDQLTRRLYVLATAPTVANGNQTIYYKATSLDAPSFAPGAGTRFIAGQGFDVNDASSTKQDLGGLPNALVLASDATNYWHNTLALGHPAPPPAATPQPRSPEAGVQPPSLTRLALRPKRFRVAGRGRRGTRVSYRLAAAATVRLTVERAARGRRVGGACVRPSRGNRGRPACTRFVRVRGALSRTGKAGANATVFGGRVGGRRLAAGRYRLAAVARTAAGSSVPRRAGFRVLPPRRRAGAA